MSMKIDRQLAHSQEMSNKVALLFQKRAKIAHERFAEQLKSACDDNAVGQLVTNPAAAAKVWTDWYEYAVDAAQRSVLFWDTMRERETHSLSTQARDCRPCCISITRSWWMVASSGGRSTMRWCESCRPRASTSIRSDGPT